MTQPPHTDGVPEEGTPDGTPDSDNTDAQAEGELYVEDILEAAQAEVDDPSAEHLADLKRVTAEYANYRKRTEANREAEREQSMRTAAVILLPVLDDLDRAQKHGDLDGDTPFSAIAAKMRAAAEKLGLTPFGEVGEEFDPQKHEAIFQQPSAEVSSEQIADVVEVGYYLGSTLIRAAKVVVSVPE